MRQSPPRRLTTTALLLLAGAACSLACDKTINEVRTPAQGQPLERPIYASDAAPAPTPAVSPAVRP